MSGGSKTRIRSKMRQQMSCRASSGSPYKNIEVIEPRFSLSRKFVLFPHLFILGIRNWLTIIYWLNYKVQVISDVNKPQYSFLKITQERKVKAQSL